MRYFIWFDQTKNKLFLSFSPWSKTKMRKLLLRAFKALNYIYVGEL